MQRGEDTDVYNVTCEDLIRKTNFTRLMRDILHTLEHTYETPVRGDKPIILQTRTKNLPLSAKLPAASCHILQNGCMLNSDKIPLCLK